MNKSALCPCQNVRRTCRFVMEEKSKFEMPNPPPFVTKKNPHVTIEKEKIDTLAKNIMENRTATEWDADGWHYTGANYQGSKEFRKERVALYILALDAINFCFWPHKILESNTLEYDHLAIALRKLAEKDDANTNNLDSYFFHPKNLANLTVKDMFQALDTHLEHYLPNIEERCRLWNELGEGLLQSSDEGTATKFISNHNSSASNLVKAIVDTFPGFRDETVWEGRFVAFYKRAQIAVGDLNAALKLKIPGLDQLTTFADYRVPQILRHWGALSYSQSLAQKVDARQELAPDEEVSIRAATVVCVDELVRIAARDSEEPVTAVSMDWYLWQVGESLNQKGELKPHHRVNTIFY